MKILFLIFSIFCSQIFAADEQKPLVAEEPVEEGKKPEFWGTGPLIAPTGTILDLGHQSYQPFVFWYGFHGAYDSNWKFHSEPHVTTVTLEPFLRFGVFPRGEFQITPLFSYTHTEGAAKWHFGDTPFNLNILLMEDSSWVHPNLILQFLATMPIGKYENLTASKLRTDISGTGSWYPGVGLIYYHEAELPRCHFLTTTGFLSYTIGTPVHVKGFNFYGGDADTRGTERPGNQLNAILSFEYTFTQNWVFAIDFDYVHADKNHFSGKTSPDAPMSNPSFEQFTIAPALEYNWSINLGIIGGCWFTAAGRNTDEFVSGVIAVYINN